MGLKCDSGEAKVGERPRRTVLSLLGDADMVAVGEAKSQVVFGVSSNK